MSGQGKILLKKVLNMIILLKRRSPFGTMEKCDLVDFLIRAT